MGWFIAFNILIIAITVIRAVVDGWISRKAQYAMWLLLPVFLLVYCIFRIPMTVNKSENTYAPVVHEEYIVQSRIDYEKETEVRPYEAYAGDSAADSSDKVITDSSDNAHSNSVTADKIHTLTRENVTLAAMVIWAAGSVIIAVFFVVNNITFAKNTRKMRRFYADAPYGNLSVYKLHNISSPFLLGHNIYISDDMDMDTDEYKYAVCHESCHYALGDHYWAILRYAIIAAFWFDPFVWVAGILVQRDSEMAVDERVIKILGEENKAQYGEALISFVARLSGVNGNLTIATSMSGRNKSFIKTRIINIMKQTRRSVAVTLIVTILLTAGAGSYIFNSRAVKGASVVSSDSTWYDYDITYLRSDSENYNIHAWYKYLDSDNAICRLFPVNEFPQMESYLVLYDSEGNDIGSVSETNYSIIDVTKLDDRFVCALFDDSDDSWYIGELDFESSQIKNIVFMFRGSHFGGFDITRIETDGELLYYEIRREGNREPVHGILIDEGNGNIVNELIVQQAFDSWSVSSEGTILLKDGREYYELMPGSDALSRCVIPDDIAQRYEFVQYLHGDYAYIIESGGTICRLNLLTGEENALYDMNCSYANVCYSDFFCLEYAEDNNLKLIRTGGYYTDYMDSQLEILSLTRADCNPNAGKQIITAVNIDWVDEYTAQLISRFNQEDNEYFIQVDHRYEFSHFSDSTYQDIDTVITDMLIEDILNGNGPDLILNANQNRQSITEDIVIDLNDLIDGDNGLNRDEYFNHIFEMMEQDGHLYEIPTSVGIYGMLIDSELIDDNRKGFTYSEYQDLYEQYGTPFNFKGIVDIVSGLMRFSGNQFMDDNGHLDIDNDDFRNLLALAELMHSSISDSSASAMYITDLPFALSTLPANYEQMRLTGIPDRTGSGPSLSIMGSISITRCSDTVDGCWRFIRMALSEEMQNNNRCIPVNTDSFESVVHMYIPDNDDAQRIRSWVMSADTVYNYNSLVDICVREEIQSYLDGSISLDDAIIQIEDRVNSHIDEYNW